MRPVFVCLAAGAALLAACSPKDNAAGGPQAQAPAASPTPSPAAQAVKAAAMPKPRAGVWRTSMTLPVPGKPGGMIVSSTVCLDQASLNDGDWMNARPKGAPECSQSYQPAAGGYSFASTCKMDGRTVTTHGVATGDFQSAYTVEMTTHMDPPPPNVPADSKMTVSARWTGPCAPGQKAGPVPGGVKMSSAG